MISIRSITVVNPSKEYPSKYFTIEYTPNITAKMKNIIPHPVTSCIGAAEKEVILLMAYLTSDLKDHLDSPSSLS